MTRRQGGFTLIELIMVMVLVGILAVFVAPSFLDSSLVYARGFHDETLALLRYAQKSAIAQRRTVCVTFEANRATLSIDNDSAVGCEAVLAGPRGEVPGRITARGSVAYTNVPAAVSFDALGQASQGQVIQVQGLGRSITLEAATGYAHE